MTYTQLLHVVAVALSLAACSNVTQPTSTSMTGAMGGDASMEAVGIGPGGMLYDYHGH